MKPLESDSFSLTRPAPSQQRTGKQWLRENMSTLVREQMPTFVRLAKKLQPPKKNALPEPEISEALRNKFNLPRDLPLSLLTEEGGPLPESPFERAVEACSRYSVRKGGKPFSAAGYFTPAEEMDKTKKELSLQILYSSFIHEVYKQLRISPYSKKGTKGFDSKIHEITAKEISDSNGNVIIKVRGPLGWHGRINTSDDHSEVIERISVNAVGCRGLIQALDELLITKRIQGFYKVPNTAEGWHGRHEPVTIALEKKATPEVLDLIKTAVQPYIRSEKDVLLGEKIMPGLALEKHPSSEERQAVIEQARRVDPPLAKAIEKYFKDGVSTGQFTAAQLAIDFLSNSPY